MNPKDEEIVRAYKICFGSPSGQIVLSDLMRLCHFRVPNEQGDIGEGMRRAFLHILHRVSLSPEQLVAMVSGQRVTVNEGE